MDVVIRPATEADRPVLERFMVALQEFERAIEPNRRPGLEMAAAHMADLLARVAAHPAAGVRLAVDPEGPVAFILWHIEEAGALVLPENRICARITDLYVEERARRRGVGRRLLAAAEAHLQGHGVRRVEIGSVAANHAAIAAYEKAGYTRCLVELGKSLG